MHTTVLRTNEALKSLAAEWSQIEPPTPFSSYEFAQAWLAHQPQGTEPFVFTVRSDDGTLLALAPWCLQRLKGGLRRLTGIGSHDSWQHDPMLLEPERAAAIGACLMEGLWRYRQSWDWISLNLRTPESLPLIGELAAKGWLVPERGERHKHNVIEFGGSFASYWAERTSSHRKKMRALTRHLEAVPHRYLLGDEDNLDRLLDALFTMHEERWRGLRDWAPYHEQIRTVCRRALSRGELCLAALEIQGRLAALDLAIRSGDRGYGLMRVFHPDFKDFSPGALLGAWMLERLCDMGCRLVDCGPGHYEWKDRYSTGQLPGMRALYAPRTHLRGLVAVLWLGLYQPWRKKSVPTSELKERLQALLDRARSPRTARSAIEGA